MMVQGFASMDWRKTMGFHQVFQSSMRNEQTLKIFLGLYVFSLCWSALDSSMTCDSFLRDLSSFMNCLIDTILVPSFPPLKLKAFLDTAAPLLKLHNLILFRKVLGFGG